VTLSHSWHFMSCFGMTQVISTAHGVELSAFVLNRAVGQTAIICAVDIARQQRQPEHGLDVNCGANN